MKRLFCGLMAVIVLVPILSGCTTYVRVPAPPPPQSEVVGVAPYTGAVWVGGHWAWRPRFGRYVWVPGHWRGAY
jgi:hypothetical protein